MKILGAVLDDRCTEQPYATTTPLRVQTLEIEAPGTDEILVRIEYAGICHSDLSVVNGDRPRLTPMLLGHESVGIIETLGTHVTGLAVGDRIITTFLPRCGKCTACNTNGKLPCIPGSQANSKGTLFNGTRKISRSGELIHHHLGVSGFASHAIVDYRSVVKVDDDVPAEVATLLSCAVLTGGGAVLNETQLKAGETTVVVGLGGVGMAALMTAVALNHGPVIGIDVSPQKRELAIQLGAHDALDPRNNETFEIKGDYVIEAAGNSAAFETAIKLTNAGGHTITVGLPHPNDYARVAPLDLVSGARTITGSYLGSSIPSRDIPLLIDLWRSGRLPLEELIDSYLDLQDINAGMDNLAAGNVLRQLIRMPQQQSKTDLIPLTNAKGNLL